MHKKDITSLANAYEQILKENLGLGPSVAADTVSVVGVDSPDTNSNRSYESDAAVMAETDMKSIAKNAHDILNELEQSGEIEPWVASKITIARDYIETVLNWISNNKL